MSELSRKELSDTIRTELAEFRNRQIDEETMTWYLKNSPNELKDAVQKMTLNDLDIIDLVANHPDERLSDFTKYTTIRQGTISKIAAKLDQAGFLEKFHEPGNQKTTYLRLLPNGELIHELHRRYHRDMDQRMAAALNQFSDGDLNAVRAFLQVINETD
ncbi:MarR family transcriptional regulator [Levilactobacillus bambusae]|uniref:HTH marR-type domain-containing protein n=1 Tax=Levilactobacillus bambusae TaxID=2024736 RepID=A0A2V1MZ94_9LACO|nr:MarR family transcriptional regulator [Levilactobacillus bambusae]PWG00341.1 hypothetical protein DCM90_05265 [Levilactobacillus bambusae]